MIYLILFILGCVVGSFLNVIILRQSIGGRRRKRSICLSCGTEIGNRDLIPIVSYFLLRGRCRSCGSRISLQYPLVEALTGLFFILAYKHAILLKPELLSIFDGLSLAVIGSILAVVFVYDLRHKIIPDWAASALVAIVLLRSIAVHVFLGDLISASVLFEMLSGIFAALPFFLLWLVSRGKWMGLGDAKLMIGLGILLGYKLLLPALALSFWMAALVVLSLILLGRLMGRYEPFAAFRNLGRKSEVPLGPFLIVGSLLVFFFPWSIMPVFFAFLM